MMKQHDIKKELNELYKELGILATKDIKEIDELYNEINNFVTKDLKKEEPIKEFPNDVSFWN